jgi:hypothetical protein
MGSDFGVSGGPQLGRNCRLTFASFAILSSFGLTPSSVSTSALGGTTGAIAADDPPSVREVVITTAILDPDPQAGMKSTQRIFVDFEHHMVRSEYETGTTEFFGVVLSSVRDHFRIENVSFAGDEVRFRAVGETASGVRVLPNINYRFDIRMNRDATEGDVTGCHDGYPSYEVRFGHTLIYWFKHKPIRLLNLFGECDQSVD